MESDMYSMAQHAVANGYGKIEYLRAQPIALSSRVSTTESPRSACSPEVARRGFGGWMRLATSTVVYPVTCGLSKPVCNRQGDRKSTRLNSSHVAISYAVFCLKKKRRMGW